MTTAGPTATTPASVLQRASLAWLAIPSWLGSLLLHSAMLLLLMAFWKPAEPRGDFPGDGGDSFRSVGIRVDGNGNGDGQQPQPSSEPAPAPSPQQNQQASIPAPTSVNLQLPTAAQPSAVIGAGPLSGLPAINVDQLIKPSLPGGNGTGGTGQGSGIGGPPGGGGGGKGTSFLGIGDVGKRFVYVIDRSSSMATDHALQAAKLELLSSIQRLDESQQFQIIFYNTEFTVLDTRGGRFDVFRGTDSQRLRVTEQIRDITPAAGTRHLPAILEGLKFNPDVLFLLTDGAAESALDRKDLEQIQKHNRGGTHIHCIEFGRGNASPLVDSANFLKELSRQNDGRYVYRNVRDILRSPDDAVVP
ncbi:vWA domain-containing protein [Planctomicrobium piriforme]|uniref:VWFA domain-containing protein n=1 Tax=Planctomicrobium piriforme TaxID=1576369 RepID=A0A1I3B210_9PLAN|nr:hypothetical protein [Planctomicrobium piriforme]SFH56378.1 hypothetical protein SAMN05421753_101187 [Planctomicrobium piriforme]